MERTLEQDLKYELIVELERLLTKAIKGWGTCCCELTQLGHHSLLRFIKRIRIARLKKEAALLNKECREISRAMAAARKGDFKPALKILDNEIKEHQLSYRSLSCASAVPVGVGLPIMVGVNPQLQKISGELSRLNALREKIESSF